MKFWLQNVGTATSGTTMCVDQFPFVIGRRKECSGCLPFAFISRQHCEFVEQEGQIFVKDLESYNGTYVNGRSAATPVAIVDGDEITLGPMSFSVLMPRADAETAKSAQTDPEIEHVDTPQPTHERGA